MALLTDTQRFERYCERLSDEQILTLNRVVSRRAALIYGPMYAEKREAHFRTSRGIMLQSQADSRARRAAAPEPESV